MFFPFSRGCFADGDLYNHEHHRHRINFDNSDRESAPLGSFPDRPVAAVTPGGAWEKIFL